MFENIPKNRPFDAYQSFVLDCKLYWTRRMFPELRTRYEALAAAHPPEGPKDVAELMRDDTTAQMFGWFERHMQRMKYPGSMALPCITTNIAPISFESWTPSCPTIC